MHSLCLCFHSLCVMHAYVHLSRRSRPSALITDASNVLVTSSKRSMQDTALTYAISDRLRGGGCVLMPVDAAGRVLELLLVVHGMWALQGLHTSYTLAFLSPQSHHTVEYASKQLEWMTDKCRKMFDTNKINPFAFKHLKLITSRAELELLPKPYCLLATNANLEDSLAQEVFGDFIASDKRNLLLFTQRAPDWSVAGQMFDVTKPNALRKPLPSHVNYTQRRRVQLEGVELEQFREQQRIIR
jgi:cleavage and polyadenylation specificity factor subunit 2